MNRPLFLINRYSTILNSLIFLKRFKYRGFQRFIIITLLHFTYVTLNNVYKITSVNLLIITFVNIP